MNFRHVIRSLNDRFGPVLGKMPRYIGPAVTAALAATSFFLLKNGVSAITSTLILLSGLCAVVFCGWKGRFWYLFILGVTCCFERHFIIHYGDGFHAIGAQALITMHITDVDEIKSYLSVFRFAELLLLLLFVAGCMLEAAFKSPPLCGSGIRRPLSIAGRAAAPLLLFAAAGADVAPPVFEHLENWGSQRDFYIARRDFKFHAVSRAPDAPLFCLLVIGESHRKDEFDRLALGEHGHAPALCEARKRGVLYEFDDMITHYQQTWFSVFTLLTRRGENGKNVLWPEKGLFSLFREAGFHTVFLTYQKKTPENLGYNYVVNEADDYIDHRDFSGTKFDQGMLPLLARLMSSPAPRQFVVIKMVGVHFHYVSRYPGNFRMYTPCYDGKVKQYEIADRVKLVNTYRNAMAFSAAFLDEAVKMIERHPQPAVMVFLSDHGVINYDDGKNVFFGGARSNFHIPCVIYGNDAFRKRMPPEYDRALRKNRFLPITNSYIFDTVASLAGIDYPGKRSEMDLTSDRARPAADRMVWVWDNLTRYDRLP